MPDDASFMLCESDATRVDLVGTAMTLAMMLRSTLNKLEVHEPGSIDVLNVETGAAGAPAPDPRSRMSPPRSPRSPPE